MLAAPGSKSAPLARRAPLVSLTLGVLAAHVLILLGLAFVHAPPPLAGGPPVWHARVVAPMLPVVTAQGVGAPETASTKGRMLRNVMPQTSNGALADALPHPPERAVPDARQSPSSRNDPPLPPDRAPDASPLAAPALAAASTDPPVSDNTTRVSGVPASGLDSSALPPAEVRLPRSAVLAYQAVIARRGHLDALASVIEWRHDQDAYSLRWRLSSPATSEREHTASGRVTARGLIPVAARGVGPDAYDISFTDASGVQDPASALIELSALIAGDPAHYPVSSRIAVTVADSQAHAPREVDFTVVQDTEILMEDGQFTGQRLPTLHLVHEPAYAQDMRIELWLGKPLDFLPVRLRITRPDGQRLEMVLREADALGQ